jgi:hypothetical protein
MNIFNPKPFPAPVLLLVFATFLYDCKKDKSSVDEPQDRIAFWCPNDDGCGYTGVYIDGTRAGEVGYWQKYGPTNCVQSIVSLPLPITRGQHVFRFTTSCKSYEVSYTISKECTLYKVE